MNRDELLKKWLNNGLSEAEEKKFKQDDDYAFNQEIIEAAKSFSASYFSNIDDFDLFKKHYNSHNRPVKKLSWLPSMLRIASVIVITFGVLYIFFYSNDTKIQTMANQKTTFELPDQSQVSLNTLSSIEYRKRKWDNNRSLKLNGEAYFVVAKGKTFDVITSDGIVTVVGTKFNVKQRKDYFEVICFEGEVKVTSGTITRKLFAGELFKIHKSIFTIEKTDLELPLWKKNRSIFKEITIKEVFVELEHQYDVKVIFKDVNTKRLFTGSFTHNDLNEALISITQPMNLSYEINSLKEVKIYEK